ISAELLLVSDFLDDVKRQCEIARRAPLPNLLGDPNANDVRRLQNTFEIGRAVRHLKSRSVLEPSGMPGGLGHARGWYTLNDQVERMNNIGLFGHFVPSPNQPASTRGCLRAT